jgi:hypothetical protein
MTLPSISSHNKLQAIALWAILLTVLISFTLTACAPSPEHWLQLYHKNFLQEQYQRVQCNQRTGKVQTRVLSTRASTEELPFTAAPLSMPLLFSDSNAPFGTAFLYGGACNMTEASARARL